MSSSGVVELRLVIEMLDACAKGYTMRPTDHHYCVRFNSAEFPTLPLGEHGSGRRTGRGEIKLGQVRQMIRQLGISMECAKKYIPRVSY